MNTTFRRVAAAVAAPAAMLFALSACGGTPTQEDLVDALVEGGQSEEDAECMAEAIYSSGISDDGLETIAGAEDLDEMNSAMDELSAEDKEAWQSGIQEAGKCLA